MDEAANANDAVRATMKANASVAEAAHASGRYAFICRQRRNGPVLWREEFDNVVCTIGKNLALDAFLSGVGYTVTGPYLGLISGQGFVATAKTDMLASHPGWLEAGDANEPTYSGARPLVSWFPASDGAKSVATPLEYNFTGPVSTAGFIQGAFLALGLGALSTIDSITGVLYSAGTFGTPQPVIAGNVVEVSYAASL